MHVHVLKLFINFQLILIKIGFLQIFKVGPCTMGQNLPKLKSREFCIISTFPGTEYMMFLCCVGPTTRGS